MSTVSYPYNTATGRCPCGIWISEGDFIVHHSTWGGSFDDGGNSVVPLKAWIGFEHCNRIISAQLF